MAIDYVRIFEFWGVENIEEKNDQYEATCLFCGKRNHFFISRISGQWDCKICTPSGGNVYTFLAEVYETFKLNTNEEYLRELSRARSVSYLKIKEWGIVPINRYEFIIPYYNEFGNLCNLKKYRVGKKPIFTPELKSSIFGLQQLYSPERSDQPIYICEGEFDTITLDWFFKKIDFKAICIGLPGHTLKKDWTDYFNNKNVTLCLDNDVHSKKGTVEIVGQLSPKAKSVKFLDWPENLSEGYDLRDYIKDFVLTTQDIDGAKTRLFNYFKAVSISSFDIETKNIPHSSFNEIKTEFAKTVELSTNFLNAFKLSLATVLSARLPGSDPVWLFLVGPPGCGKSTICTAFSLAMNAAIFESSLSSKALVSGWSGARGTGFDPSLVPKLNDKCLVLKDFTEILSRNKIEKDEIFGVLRGAYDGTVKRTFANGTQRIYQSKFSIVAGVTRAIYAEEMVDLGERFLRFNMQSSSNELEKQQDMALESGLKDDTCKIDVQRMIYGFMEREFKLSLLNLRELIPEWFIQKLKRLTTLIAVLRTPVARHRFGRMQHEIIYSPEPETGNRLGVQFQRLSLSLAVMEDKEIDKEIYNLLKAIGKDTINGYVYNLISCLYKENEKLSVSELAFKVGVTQTVVYHLMNDLAALKVVDLTTIKDQTTSKSTPFYSLNTSIRNLIEESEFYE